jgi:hypothetical protein
MLSEFKQSLDIFRLRTESRQIEQREVDNLEALQHIISGAIERWPENKNHMAEAFLMGLEDISHKIDDMCADANVVIGRYGESEDEL